MSISKKCTNKKRKLAIGVMFVLLTVHVSSFTAYAAGSAAHTAQLSSMDASAYAGTGSSTDPYRIAVAGNENGSNTAFTAPNSFWGDASSDTGVSGAAVVFERFEGDTTEGKLISSMAFDLGKNGTDVWDGTWTYALRLAPWTGYNTSTGDLLLGFSYKGNFSTYFNDWVYKFDAQSLTADLEEEKQVKPGDTISLTYIGAYDDSQTSKGTNYKINYGDVDSDVESVVSAVVDDNGYAAFSGANMLTYGGNYRVAITNPSDDPADVPDDSENTPDDSENTPDDSDNAPDDSEDIPDDADNAPEDSDKIPDASDKENDTDTEKDESFIGGVVGDVDEADNGQSNGGAGDIPQINSGEANNLYSGETRNTLTAAPKTGDVSNAELYVVICVAAGAGILFAVRKMRRV